MLKVRNRVKDNQLIILSMAMILHPHELNYTFFSSWHSYACCTV